MGSLEENPNKDLNSDNVDVNLSESKIVPSTKKKKLIPLLPPFNWTEYLIQTQSKAAPATCFCQNSMLPKNEFKIGHKLETNDPRNKASICIASVIEVLGSRLRLRLDGSDDRNDFWLMCDSDQIHPFEYSTKKGVKIQPPMGFVKDLSRWPKFLEKMIQSAGEGQFAFAPETIFSQPPSPPSTNMFKIGQKLEAVDQQNPRLVFPATIKDINENKVLISFDGWGQYGQFWCLYTSRDLFPVGWCQSTGHEIQYPGSLVEKTSFQNQTTNTNETVTNFDINNNYTGRMFSNSQISQSSNKKSSKKRLLSKTIESDYSTSNSSKKMKKGFKGSKPFRTNDDLAITKKKVIDWSVENVAYYLSNIGENNSLVEYADLFKDQKIDGNSLLSLNIDVLIKQLNLRVGPAVKLNEFIERLRKTSLNNISSLSSINKTDHISIQPRTVRLMKELIASNNNKLKVTDWSIEEVVNYIENVGRRSFSGFSSKFREHKIDGEALLSLNTENLVEHFQMKLGPAIQLNDYLEKLRCSVLSNLFINQQKLHIIDQDLI